ncbi:Exodeoxyribonuclease VII large subunit [Arboricoccus pini]|uniref:Exodeoxyribonuclease 7 large subunit n=1 Tax=Arboricoccus pini TaxID=1963835 RepID=A0A212QP32_9PROT|nr:exodeoxyribonuclease VII large subunit [Arboricoccus pini]SNB61021.1 Exodeoxyribonuclease VII large subunit [Arboricoccus pini]
MSETSSNIAEYSVSELAFALKRTVEDSFGLVRVRGEISGFKRAASGHVYLALKDDRAVLDAVAWRNTLGRLAFEPGDGLEVICVGRLTTYPGRSKYQLVVERMEPAGIGALLAQLDERRRRLEAEGLFDVSRKRPLPVLPGVIGIVTSPTGSVIRDILHRLEERFPRRVLVWPVPVQGEGAREAIAAAIDGFSGMPEGGAIPRPDLIIVARGGGSIEDLWAFNEEIVVRAAAACSIPLISAVGHETDTTLIDLAADHRAPTPTAAAEMAVPVRRELMLQLDQLRMRQQAGLGRTIDEMRRHVDGVARGLAHPSRLLGTAAQRLDDLSERLRLRPPAEVVRVQRLQLLGRGARLDEVAADMIRRSTEALSAISGRLAIETLTGRLETGLSTLARMSPRLDQATRGRLRAYGERVEALSALCHSLGPQRVLERGYVLVRDETGSLVTTADDAKSKAHLSIVFRDAALNVVPELDERPITRRRPAGNRSKTAGKQETLL